MKYSSLNRVVSILMDMMDIAEEDGINFEPRLRLGSLAFSRYASDGISEIAELKCKFADRDYSYRIEKEHNQRLQKILQTAFGDEEFDNIPEDIRKDILEYSQKKIKEWEKTLGE